MNLPSSGYFRVVLVALVLMMVLVVPATAAASHVYQQPKPNKVAQPSKGASAGFYGVASGVGKVLGEATEATVEGTQSLWGRFTNWLASIFGRNTTVVKKTTQVVKAPAATPAPVPQVTEVSEVTKVIEQAGGVSAEDLAGVGLYAANNELNVNVGLKAYKIVQLDKDGKLPAGLDGSNVSNLNADYIKGGTLSSDRVTGKYLSISGVGTILEGKWEGSVIADTYIANDLTINSIGTAETTSDLTINAKGGQLVLTDTQTLAIGGATTGLAYNVIGDNTTNASANVASDDDLYVEGNLEVDGTIYGTVSGTITTGFTQGSVTFADASGNLAQDNANFFWDDTNNRLGIGTASPNDVLDLNSALLGYSFRFGSNGITASTSGTGGVNLDTYGQLSLMGWQSAASAVELVSRNGGIDISTGSGTQNIDILSGSGANLVAVSGGIDISTGGQGSAGGSIDILSGQGAATAITIVAGQGGIDISTGSATQDIDILGGASLNLRSTEAAADSITIVTNGATGGIDISTGGQLGQGGSIDILSGQAAAAAITVVSAQGGIDISTGSGAAGNDIDILGGSSVNIRSTESVADSITIITNGVAGGIDISTGGQLGQGGAIDILSGNAAAAALTLVTPQGGIDISTGSGAAGNDIDLLSGSSINITAREQVADAIVISAVNNAGIDISTGYDAGAGRNIDVLGGSGVNLKALNADITLSSGTITTSSGMAVDSATGMVGIWNAAPREELHVSGDIMLNANNAATTFGLCHSGVDSDNTFEERSIVACSAAPEADYAERYPVVTGAEYGDVVATGTRKVTTDDGKTIVQLVKSQVAYQHNVVGVVSDNYGDFTSAGNNVPEGENPMPVALNGRVPVKVTNEGGQIAVGDYLTTSSTPGYAMKANQGGMVLGMALDDFTGETGQVMVFVGRGYVDESVYEQMAVLAALGMSEKIEEITAQVLGIETGELEQADSLGGLVATTDGGALATGDEPLPVLKTQNLDELTVTTAAKFQGSLVVVGEAIFEGLLTVNGAEVKGDLGVVGAVTQAFTAGEDIVTGDAVYLASENTVRKASAASEGTLPAVGIAANSAGAGSSVKVAIAGTVSGLANLNTGRRYYVGVGSGSITVTAPTGSSQGVQVIGVARSGSQLVVMPGLNYSTNSGVVLVEPVASPVPSASVEPVVLPTPEPSVVPTPLPSVAPEASGSAVSQ